MGFKPCFVFRGPEFEQKEEYKKFANLLLDILSTLLPSLSLLRCAFRCSSCIVRALSVVLSPSCACRALSAVPLFRLGPLSLTRSYISTEER